MSIFTNVKFPTRGTNLREVTTEAGEQMVIKKPYIK